MNVDPLADQYPWSSPYVYVNNNPLLNIDPNGQEWYQTTEEYGEEEDYIDENGETQTRTVTKTRKVWQWFEDTPEMEVWTGEYDSDGNKVTQTVKGQDFAFANVDGADFILTPDGSVVATSDLALGEMPLSPGNFGRLLDPTGLNTTWNYWQRLNRGKDILKQSSQAIRAAYDAWLKAGGATQWAQQAQRVAQAGQTFGISYRISNAVQAGWM